MLITDGKTHLVEEKTTMIGQALRGQYSQLSSRPALPIPTQLPRVLLPGSEHSFTLHASGNAAGKMGEGYRMASFMFGIYDEYRMRTNPAPKPGQ